MTFLNHALKEWNVAVNALSEGKTIALLRKGGIREVGGNFQVTYNRVLLYPTFEHQLPNLLKSEYALDVIPVESGWHPQFIKIQSWANITDVFSVTDETRLASLFPYHVWSEAFVRDRLQWKPNQPLYLLLLRTYKLDKVYEIPYDSTYAGCRSWIDLIEPINIETSTPVLSDFEYQEISHELIGLVA